jgi:hypothetical protein
MLAYSILLLIGYIAAIIALLATADGIVDWSGRPLGTDFANVYAAGKLAAEGQPALAYNWPAHHAAQKDIARRADVPYYGWHYPPAFLLVAALLAAMPYLGALFAYQAATLAAYLGVVGRIVGRCEGRLTCLLALAFPAAFINVGHGHNGFLTAALMGGALLLLDRRPWAAGALVGCLAYKPQFGLLIPLVLMATGRWRVFFASAMTLLAICGLTWSVFGSEAFAAFWHSLAMTQLVIAEGAPGFHKIQSIYAAFRLLGAPAGIANAVQLLASISVAIGIVALWRSGAAYELKAAGLLIGSLLATPYVLDYDLVVLAPGIAFMTVHGLRHGFAPYEITSLVALWTLPLVARSLAALTTVSLGPIVMLAALGLILYRARILPALGTIAATRAR